MKSIIILVATLSLSQGLVYMYPPQFGFRRSFHKPEVIQTPAPIELSEFTRPATMQQKIETLILLEQMYTETFNKLIEISKCEPN